MQIKWTAAVAAFALSTAAHAEDCTSIIALSRVTSTVVSSADEVKSNASAFCSSYSRHQGSSNTSDFGASYKFLSATFSSGSASVDDVASRYCSSSNDYQASSNAYANYIESIAPGAYDAYTQCVGLEASSVKFTVNTGSVLPAQFAMFVNFHGAGVSKANFRFTTSDGVSCQWDGVDTPEKQIFSPGTATLSCRRANATKKAFVTVARVDGPEQITVPWQAYTSEGVPIDLVNALNKRVSDMGRRLEDATNELDKIQVETGEVGVAADSTNDLMDDSECKANGYRGKDERVTFPVPFRMIPKVMIALEAEDIYTNSNIRLRTRVTGVDQSGFDFQLQTWCNTKVQTATASWVALSR